MKITLDKIKHKAILFKYELFNRSIFSRLLYFQKVRFHTTKSYLRHHLIWNLSIGTESAQSIYIFYIATKLFVKRRSKIISGNYQYVLHVWTANHICFGDVHRPGGAAPAWGLSPRRGDGGGVGAPKHRRLLGAGARSEYTSDPHSAVNVRPHALNP